MPALLKNPLTVPANPVFATGARLDELTVEATRKMAYIMNNFRMCRQYVGDSGDFNRSLARLKVALAGSFDAKRDLQSVHIELCLVIQHHAEKHADGRGNFGHLSPEDLEAGARKAVETLSPYRGRTRDPVLWHHVEGLMATIQECCGLPVLAARSRNGIYDPQGTNTLGRMLIEQVRNVHPTVTETRIVNIMLAARRKHAGKAVGFRHYFPTYGKEFRQVGSALTH